jgi:hypothetical protein
MHPGSSLRRRNPWLALLLSGCALAFAGTGQQRTAAVFPSITSYSLDKQKVTLPSGMEGQTDLLILSFAPEQQHEVDSWLPVAQGLQHSSFQFRYYQLPIQGRENFIFRWWASSSMRSNQTDPETWHWIVPLFVDRQPFLRDLNIPNEKQVVALLVDRQGHILWRASGPLTEDKRASLLAAAGQH